VYDPSAGTEPNAVPKGAYAPSIIVLLTDGVSNSGPTPLSAAQQAADRGIRVFTIGYGTANGSESIPNCNPGAQQPNDPFFFGGGNFGGGGFGGFRRGIDEDTLKKVADMTGGKYYSAESSNDLETIFRSLPTDTITKHETTELSVFFAMAGALLLGLSLVLSFLWSPLL